ncbi:ARM repeat-containing protein [Suillus ampliporus]|nr:ARM repeat-containing protein [Suillus ampliporus]
MLSANLRPLKFSANRWLSASTVRKVQPDADSPEMVDRKVKGLLNKLTMRRFDSISDQIIYWANKSVNEKDGRTLIQVIRLVFEKATDEAAWSEMYARLCRKMMEQISPEVQDDEIKNTEGKPIPGSQLFRKYLLNRCQEDFEHRWFAKEANAAAKASDDQGHKAASEKKGEEGHRLFSDEYFAAQNAKGRSLGLVKFIGELFKVQMIKERIMHECAKKLLGSDPQEEVIESSCQLFKTAGQLMDTPKARAFMDVYFTRMKQWSKGPDISPRMQFMLLDVIELRDRKWVSCNAVAAPIMIAAFHDLAVKEKVAAENGSYNRQISMSRGGDCNQEHGPDSWAVAGGFVSQASPKYGDLSQFGKISKRAPMIMGPSSVFPGSKNDSTRELRSRTNSNMLSMLSQNPEFTPETSTKPSRPSSQTLGVNLGDAGAHEPAIQRRKLQLLPQDTSTKPSRPSSQTPGIDLGDAGAPEPAIQHRKLQLLPRDTSTKPSRLSSRKPTIDLGHAGAPESAMLRRKLQLLPRFNSTARAPTAMSEAEAKKKIDEDVKEFFAVRSLKEADVYFTNLPDEHRFRLVDKLVASALESKEADVKLVGDFFAQATSNGQCSLEVFEEGFMPMAEFLDNIAIDAPMAFNYMAIMLKGAGFEKEPERLQRIASKLEDSDKLVSLIA